jgi:hypothetical protein
MSFHHTSGNKDLIIGLNIFLNNDQFANDYHQTNFT